MNLLLALVFFLLLADKIAYLFPLSKFKCCILLTFVENTRSRWSPVGLVHVVPYLSLKTKLQCRLVNNEFNRLLLRNPQTKKQLRLAFDWRLNEIKRLTRAEMANGYYFEVIKYQVNCSFLTSFIIKCL